MLFRDFVVKGAVGAACTAVLTLCGAVITSSREDAVQDQQLQAIAQRQADTDVTLRHLDDNVRQLDVDVAVLTERLKERGSHVALQPKKSYLARSP